MVALGRGELAPGFNGGAGSESVSFPTWLHDPDVQNEYALKDAE